MWAFFIAVAELTSLLWVKILISCEFPGISLGISLFQNAGNIKFPAHFVVQGGAEFHEILKKWQEFSGNSAPS